MSASLKGRSVVVTGGSKGIGKGIARVFAGAGAKVAIIARHLKRRRSLRRRNRPRGLWPERRRDLAVQHGSGAENHCREKWRHRCALRQCRHFSAGAAGGHDLGTMGRGDRHQSQGHLPCRCKAAIPYLKKSDQGRIVITSSITGPVTGFPGWTHYGASKAGQLGFMRTACIELAKYGITVNAVMPGNIVTEGLAGMGEEYQKSMAASVPLKRLGTRRRHRPRRALLRFEGSSLRDRPNHHRRWRADPARKPGCAGAGVTEIRRRYGTAWKGCTW